jgi:protein gp37
MGENTKIEWATHTFNPWIGCAKVSPGCQHCYAEALMDTRYGTVKWGIHGTRKRTSPANWRKPVAWNRRCGALGIRERVFCCSLADVFEDRPDLSPIRLDLFRLILATPHLDWLLLTKRPEKVMALIFQAIGQLEDGDAVATHPMSPEDSMLMAMLSAWYQGIPPTNVWVGTSVENQKEANKRIPELLAIPAEVRFLSMEPLLGPVDLVEAQAILPHVPAGGPKPLLIPGATIGWVIVGGESGQGARPMHPEWVTALRDQCEHFNIPFFFKQWGSWDQVVIPRSPFKSWEYVLLDVSGAQLPTPTWRQIRTVGSKPGLVAMHNTGKSHTGRFLVNRYHDAIPRYNV